MNDSEVVVIGGAPGEHCIGALAKGLRVALVRQRYRSQPYKNSPQLLKSRCRCGSFGTAEAVP